MYHPTRTQRTYWPRGISFKKFKKQLCFWLNGPVLWMMYQDSWPVQKPVVVMQELCADIVLQHSSTVLQSSSIDCTRFSKSSSPIRTTHYVFFFKFGGCTRSPEEYWICSIQRSNVDSEVLPGSTIVSSLINPIKKFVKDLGLYFDSSGVIPSHDCLKHSLYHSADQIFLPPNSYVTTLIILQANQTVKHGGMAETLMQLRLQLWVQRGAFLLRKPLKVFARCQRILAICITKPNPPPLPRERIKFVWQFDSVEIDYTRAILIRDESTNELATYTYASSHAPVLALYI